MKVDLEDIGYPVVRNPSGGFTIISKKFEIKQNAKTESEKKAKHMKENKSLNKYLKSLIGKKIFRDEQQDLILKINYKVQWRLMKSYSKLNEFFVLKDIPYMIIPKKSSSARYWMIIERYI